MKPQNECPDAILCDKTFDINTVTNVWISGEVLYLMAHQIFDSKESAAVRKLQQCHQVDNWQMLFGKQTFFTQSLLFEVYLLSNCSTLVHTHTHTYIYKIKNHKKV